MAASLVPGVCPAQPRLCFGTRLGPRIRALDPDLIISTYPLGSAGLGWLRRRGRLGMPAGAWVPAFCPHPSWLYRDLDITFVMHPAAAAAAARAEPGLRVAVGALPVRDVFAPQDQAAARARLGLAADRFTVALCPGSLAFGRVGCALTALLAAGPDVCVIAVCGHNERLRRELAGRGLPPGRLRVLGWTDDMPGWMGASDVVVGNAGGATALEALAAGRPVINRRPAFRGARAGAAAARVQPAVRGGHRPGHPAPSSRSGPGHARGRAVPAAGIAGFLLNQSAFQAGVLIAPVLAIITALDPLISIGIARIWLDESFASSPADLAAEALSLAVMTGGIVALAHRAPQVARNVTGPAGPPGLPLGRARHGSRR